MCVPFTPLYYDRLYFNIIYFYYTRWSSLGSESHFWLLLQWSLPHWRCWEGYLAKDAYKKDATHILALLQFERVRPWKRVSWQVLVTSGCIYTPYERHPAIWVGFLLPWAFKSMH